MKWPEFEREIERRDWITLVGPLLGQAHAPRHPTVYVDGGSRFRPKNSQIPTISVGDGDSSPSTLDEVLDPNKDFSDLAYVLDLLPASIRHVELFGFLGGRRDHELLALGEVHRFLKNRPYSTRAIFDDQIQAFSHGDLTIDIDGTFSVVSFSPGPVTISGSCRFPFSGMLPAVCSLGLSNEGSGPVHFHSLEPCFVFTPSAQPLSGA